MSVNCFTTTDMGGIVKITIKATRLNIKYNNTNEAYA